LRKNAADPAWREKVSRVTTEAMHRPATRAKHLAALQGQTSNFKGGMGQPLTPFILARKAELEPIGYIHEYPIPTKGHGTAHRAKAAYVADFAHPTLMKVIEFDGPCHRPHKRQELDRKKTEVLEALGWTVTRIRHD
jgi:hypothetical protein